jgi:hypothetical protein
VAKLIIRIDVSQFSGAEYCLCFIKVCDCHIFCFCFCREVVSTEKEVPLPNRRCKLFGTGGLCTDK